MINAERIEMRPGTHPEVHSQIINWLVNGFVNTALGRESYLVTNLRPKNPIRSILTGKEYEDNPLGTLTMQAEDIAFTFDRFSITNEERKETINLMLSQPTSIVSELISEAVWYSEKDRDPQHNVAQPVPSLKLSDVIFENS